MIVKELMTGDVSPVAMFLASPDAQEVMWVSEWVTDWSGLADLTDDTFRRLGTWVTHDHLSSVIDWYDPSEWWYL